MSLSSCRSSCVGSSLLCCRSCCRLAESDSCRECLRSSIVVSCFRHVAACLMLGRNFGLLLSSSPSRRPRSLRRFDVSWCPHHHHVALEAYDVLMVLGMSSLSCRSAPDANWNLGPLLLFVVIVITQIFFARLVPVLVHSE